MIQVNTNGILCNYTEFALNAVSGDKCLVCTLVSAFYKHNAPVVSTDACPILPSNVGYLAGKSTNRISAEGLKPPQTLLTQIAAIPALLMSSSQTTLAVNNAPWRGHLLRA